MSVRLQITAIVDNIIRDVAVPLYILEKEVKKGGINEELQVSLLADIKSIEAHDKL